MTNRQIMLSALQTYTIPCLRDIGLEGKYPHFRRQKDNCIELITFQTNKHGGAFTIEVSAVFPNSKNKNYSLFSGISEEKPTVWNTIERYRLNGMFDGWFYYRDVYQKRTLRFGTLYHDISEKESANYIPTNGWKIAQKFSEDTAIQICHEVNTQLEKAYSWLQKFEKKHLS